MDVERRQVIWQGSMLFYKRAINYSKLMKRQIWMYVCHEMSRIREEKVQIGPLGRVSKSHCSDFFNFHTGLFEEDGCIFGNLSR